MKNTKINSERVVLGISSKQKGDVTENRESEIIMLGSNGRLTCYTPNSDDDGIDLIINPKSEFKPIFIQVKSRFVLQKSGRFVQNVGKGTFSANKNFFLLFMYFDEASMEVDTLWFIPSIEFASLAYDKKEGKTYKSFYRFNAGPNSTKDKWVNYRISKSELGNKILRIIETNY
ncbi:MAG: hypothetical protein NXI10_13820 [bacterium]|nr:hypothetical protein [bacterium]